MNRQNKSLLKYAMHSAWDLVDDYFDMAAASSW